MQGTRSLKKKKILFTDSGSEEMQTVHFYILFLSNPVTGLDRP